MSKNYECYRCKKRGSKAEEFVHIIPSNRYRCKEIEDCHRRAGHRL